jgi:DNA polymerase II large subunit
MTTKKMNLSEYFGRLDTEFERTVDIAKQARKKGFDPTKEIEIAFAKDMAERCEKLLQVDGLAERIRELEDSGMGREEASLELARMFAEGELGDFETDEDKIDAAVRTAVALLTEGVVAAPIEGIESVTLEPGDDGEYIRIRYAGPIRSAGGTGQALSVLAADYVRQLMGLPAFNPREEEVERIVTELKLYDMETGLQYMPSDEDIRRIVENTPIMFDGVGVSKREVSAYRDLERVDTNSARGGMCLTIGEGVAQKAAKLQKYTGPMGIEGWDWLADLDLGVSDGDASSDEDEDAEADEPEPEERPELKPKKKYIKGLIAGRPMFSEPSRPGGFRLRYGRPRNTGLAATGVSPATMAVFHDSIATGTQLKIERPGKAAGIAPVDSLEGPTVRLANGEVRRIDDEQEVRKVLNSIETIIDIGEMAVPYGEFLENNHPLAPASYVHEWWSLEADKAGFDATSLPIDSLNANQAFAIGEKHNIPLHPKFTYLWHDLTLDQYRELSAAVDQASIEDNEMELPMTVASSLESLLVPHHQHDADETLTVKRDAANVLSKCCGPVSDGETTVIGAVNETAPVTVRERAPTRIGARMGRPEASKRREKTKFHGLYPVGHNVGNYRLIKDQVDLSKNVNDTSFFKEKPRRGAPKQRKQAEDDLSPGEVLESLTSRTCTSCETDTWRMNCHECGSDTQLNRHCSNCDIETGLKEVCTECNRETNVYKRRPFPIAEAWSAALENVGMSEQQAEKAKGVRGLESESKIPEPLEKALLRSKYDLLAFADGTIRYDVGDLPLTAFKPEEVSTSIEQLHKLGYRTDIDGDPLERGDQMVELMVQDVVIHTGAAEYLLSVANFIDELLVSLYGMEPHYDADSIEDLVGHMVIGMAPHTSAGMLGRIIGFTRASVGYAHPFYHAAKRRNCFHPETELSVEINGEWRRFAIQQLVETYLDPEADGYDNSYDDGTVVHDLQQHPDIDSIRVPSMNDEGQRTIESVTHISKHTAQNHMVEIELDNGETLVVTPDHSVPVIDSDRPSNRLAFGVNAGDELFDYSHVSAATRDGREPSLSGELNKATVRDVRYVESGLEYTYNLTVENTHRLECNSVVVNQCDGDQDSFMLLMDGLLNYSEQYLNHNRSGWSMDKPIVMTTTLDPTEIDGEAHNVDMCDHYPLELYEESLRLAGPKDVDIEIAEEHIEGDFTGFKHTMETSSFDAGPEICAYKSLDDNDVKIQLQLDLARGIRAVDSSHVAEVIIDTHLLPDIRGNLRAFAQQGVRCTCGEKYRRPPFDGQCRDCGRDLLLNVYEGMVTKYIGPTLDIAEEHDVDEYIRQSVELIQNETDSLFKNQHDKQTGLAEFM